MKKTKVKMNKPIYLGLSILENSKILMYEFWYDYMKPKYDDNVKLCYTDTDSFIMNIKTEEFYTDIANDVEKRFDTSNYEVDRSLPTGKNKKVIGLMKDELGGKIMIEFVALRPKKFNDDKDCLLNDKVVLKSQQRVKRERHDVYTENVNKIALSSNEIKDYQLLIKLQHILMDIKEACKRDLLERLKYKMINFDDYTNENKIEHNPK